MPKKSPFIKILGYQFIYVFCLLSIATSYGNSPIEPCEEQLAEIFLEENPLTFKGSDTHQKNRKIGVMRVLGKTKEILAANGLRQSNHIRYSRSRPDSRINTLSANYKEFLAAFEEFQITIELSNEDPTSCESLSPEIEILKERMARAYRKIVNTLIIELDTLIDYDNFLISINFRQQGGKQHDYQSSFKNLLKYFKSIAGKKYDVTVVNLNDKSATLQIKSRRAGIASPWYFLRSEIGTHRFEKKEKGKTFSYYADVKAWPVPKNQPFNESDVVESQVNGSGSGGQNRDRNQNGVVLKHKVTGITVRSDRQRSLEANRRIAYDLLRQKILASEAQSHNIERMAHTAATNLSERLVRVYDHPERTVRDSVSGRLAIPLFFGNKPSYQKEYFFLLQEARLFELLK